MVGMLPLLREMFPGKVMLTVEDVAQVLGRTGAGGYEQTREQLAAGVIVPGLRKVGGSWLVPITALAAALDSLVQLDDEGRAAPKELPARRAVLPSNPLVDRPRRGRIPNRLKQQQARAVVFWSVVLSVEAAVRLDAVIGPPTCLKPREGGRL